MSDFRKDYHIFGISHQKGLAENTKFHTHFQYEIFIFHNGNVNYFLGNRIYELEAGDIILIDGSLMHRPFVMGDARFYERSIVQFSKDWIIPALTGMKLNHLLTSFEENHFKVIRAAGKAMIPKIVQHIENIEQFLQAPETKHANELMMVELIQILIHAESIQAKSDVQYNTETDEKYLYIQQTLAYIENHFHDKFTLDDVAKHLSISKSYLVHLFKDLTGKTIMDYTMNYRLKQAMHHLVFFPDLSNQEIGLRCGFENPSHFSYYFKKSVGISPRDFRKK